MQRQQLQGDPSSYELHLVTHIRPDRTFADEKSRRITAEVERRLSENYSFRPYEDSQSGDVHPSVEEVNIFRCRRWCQSSTSIRSRVCRTDYVETTPRRRGPSQMRSTVAAQDEAIRATREKARLEREQSQRLKVEHRGM
ncbi:uncharacterized protein [Henckelia pumila]|uniref:uncharacterized protein n=1 Tax=Henckelia pumila TaxID=405737 RepID=UPI003C6DE485